MKATRGMRMTNKAAPGRNDGNVVPLFTEGGAAPAEVQVESLSGEEIVKLRQMMREWAMIRASCPMAIRLLSERKD